jgi:hypothetical protein
MPRDIFLPLCKIEREEKLAATTRPFFMQVL